MTVVVSERGGVSISYITRVYSFIKAISELKDYEEKRMQGGNTYNEAKLLFRGHADADYKIAPSLVRGQNNSGETLISCERELIQEAKYIAPDVFRNDYQPLELLALLRHHSMPTRLIDVTSNALVALYFACCGQKEKPGEVIVFVDNSGKSLVQPLVNAIADTSRLTQQEVFTPLNEFVDRMKKEPYGYEIREKIQFDESWMKKQCEEVMFVNAPFHSRRQQAQSGKYILFPNRIEERNGVWGFSNTIESIEKLYPKVRKIFRIGKDDKEKILTELEWMGIDEAVLFSDNPDKICEQIAKEYRRKLHIES